MAKTMIEADGGTYKEGDITPVNHSFYHTDALLTDKADAATYFRNSEEKSRTKCRLFSTKNIMYLILSTHFHY